ncbi:hypothetical protein HMPREF1991_01707, partial [Hoylesella loescheii DSM 19665 = JCM 12249 = ATCC 15930]
KNVERYITNKTFLLFFLYKTKEYRYIKHKAAKKNKFYHLLFMLYLL